MINKSIKKIFKKHKQISYFKNLDLQKRPSDIETRKIL